MNINRAVPKLDLKEKEAKPESRKQSTTPKIPKPAPLTEQEKVIQTARDA